MSKKFKQLIVKIALPIIRFYIRYGYSDKARVWLYNKVCWRELFYTVRTSDDIIMAGRSDDIVQGRIYYFGIWEPNLTHYIKNSLTDSTRTFIDIGANVGYYSLLAAKLLPKGKVIAFEALPNIFKKLKNNIQLNNFSNIDAINIAVTDEPKNITMHYSFENEGASTSKFHQYENLPADFEQKTITVEGKTLDTLLDSNDLKAIRLIKIDVEGAEYEVLQGLFKIIPFLSDDAEIIVEITPEVLAKNQIDSIFTSFESLGFTAFNLENDYSIDCYISLNSVYTPTALSIKPTSQTDVIFRKSA